MATKVAPKDTKTMLAQVRALELEFGVEAFEAPTGHQHIRFTKETGVVDNSNPPRLRLAMEVVCGPKKGRKVSDFVGYFADPRSNSEKPLKERRGEAKSMFIRRLAGVVLSLTDDSSRSTVYDAWRGLPRDNQEADPNIIDEAEDALGNIGLALEDTEAHVEVSKKLDKQGNETDYTAVKYIKHPSQVACGCIGPRSNPFDEEGAAN